MQTYQLFIELRFPVGQYVYTGSARCNLEARIQRHLSITCAGNEVSSKKKKHWHIDYLLSHPQARITGVERFLETECDKNQQVQGTSLVLRFGASDCKRGCNSHLKYLGAL